MGAHVSAAGGLVQEVINYGSKSLQGDKDAVGALKKRNPASSLGSHLMFLTTKPCMPNEMLPRA
jgi:hypothetical protein